MEKHHLYNSVLLATFMDLVKSKYPQVSTQALLEYAKVSPYELEDKGHWFTQEQVDRFHEYLVSATGNPDIAREAGRFVIQSKSSDILRQYTSAFVTPRVAYWAMGKIASTVSRHITFDVSQIAASTVALNATPKEGVREKPYQCENRIGLFEGLGKFFTGEYPAIEHSECLHKGDSACKYIISWKRTPATLWKMVCGYASLAAFILLIVLFFVLPLSSWLISLPIVVLALAGIFLVSEKMTNKDLSISVEGQRNITEKYIKQLEVRYNELALIKEIGEAASSIFDPRELFHFIADALQKRLQFDRGMIMLANPEKTKLVYCTGYGYTPHEEALLRYTNFNLTNPDSKGVFYLAYRHQKPFLIDSAQDIKQDVSEKTSSFIKDFGIDSFICVPIIYEGRSEGILAVDNHKNHHPPTQSDLSLLLGIAQQIGISLNNALAHKKIRESEERFRNLSDNSPDIIYQLDAEGRIKYANPAWEAVLGHNIEQDLQNRKLADFLLNEDRPAFNATLQSILSEGLTIRDKNFTLLNKKQLPRYITFTGTPDCDAEGNVIGIVGTLKDITKLRSMEAQLLQASKMEAVGTLTGGIAHDFNNIIQAIMGYNQLMISGRLGNEADMPYLNSIGELITRSRELVRQLLLFSKKVEPLPRVVNINQEIKSINNLLLTSIPKMIEIKLDLCEDVFPIKADATQIVQIMMNLVINARDAMGDSGVITIKTANLILHEDTRINLMHINPGAYVCFSVSDTGCGMDPDLTRKIFEPFFTTKEPGKGTGLGLAVVQGIVNNHEGYIYCESELDKGTTFHIILPASTSKFSTQITQEQPKKLPGGTEKILLVDDEKSILETVQDTLRLSGYRMITAQSGEQAVDIYRRQEDEIDLVILDLIMPGGGGKKCLHDLLEINRNIKVLMTSGHSSAEQTDDLILAGAAGFIHKPYRPEDLLLAIREILDKRHHSDSGRVPLHNSNGV